MNQDYEKKLGQQIRQLRMQHGLSQELLAAKLQLLGCDITRSTVAKIEVGQRHIYPDELCALQTVFHVPYSALMPPL